MQEKQSFLVVEIDAISANDSSEKTLFIRAHNVGDRSFTIKVIFNFPTQFFLTL